MTEPTSSPDMVEGCHVFPPSGMAEHVKRGRTLPLSRRRGLLDLGRELDLAAQFQSLCVEN